MFNIFDINTIFKHNNSMKNMISFANAIKNRRLELNMTMESLANKVGITRSTLWSIEKGTSNCSINVLFRILDELNLSINLTDSNLSSTNRFRASRINSTLDKKNNSFIIMCVENYANYFNKASKDIYKQFKDKNILETLKEDYEDLHGMSSIYLNEYISNLLR